MIFFVSLLALSALAYLGFVVWIFFGLKRLDAPQVRKSGALPTISVVIAARNESRAIAACLQSLATQTLAPLELIVIDDASDDGTLELIRSQSVPRLIALRNDAPLGKKPSLAKGIGLAKGDVIACTDADCLVPPTWLEGVANAFQDESLGFLSMPVVYCGEKTLFERCESLDFLSLVAIGGALIKLGTPAICNGANIAYRRALFFQTGGFGKTKLASGDDEAVMRNIFKAGHNVDFLASASVTVKTTPVGSLGGFLKQRIRWASKGSNYGDVSLSFLALLALIYLFNVLLFLSPFWIWVENAWAVASCAFGAKFIADWLAVAEMTRRFGQEPLRRAFLAAEFLQIAYVALAPLLAELLKLGKGYEWKGVNRK